ncbi:hypothetical protein AB8O64_35605 (plasmid) [Streptomyces sp. QH1-20]|uniref:hypothetical protein n=1 Tax=Streptomyces sp. QH1-20 TaxID=3240934 RepID=UPI003518FA67
MSSALAQQVISDINAAVEQHRDAVLQPAQLGIYVEGTAPEQQFLKEDLVIHEPTLDKGSEHFTVRGKADLQGLGSEIPLRVSLIISEDGALERVELEPERITGMSNHPLLNPIASQFGIKAETLLVTSFYLNCHIKGEKPVNYSRLHIPFTCPVDRKPLKLIASVGSSSSQGDPSAILMSASVHAEFEPDGGLPAKVLAQWAGVSDDTVPAILSDMTSTGFTVSWGKELSSLNVSLEGESTLLGVACHIELSFSASASPAGLFDSWSAGGTARTRLTKGSQEEQEFVFYLKFAHEFGRKTISLSAAIEEGARLNNLSELHELPFVPGPDQLNLTGVPQDLTSGHVSVGSLSVVYDLNKKTCTALGAKISIEGPWEIIPDVFSLTNIGLWLICSPQTSVFHAGMESSCTIGSGLSLSASASFPDRTVTLSADPIELTDFDAQSNKQTQLPHLDHISSDRQKLTLRHLGATCVIGNDWSYSLDLALATSLSLPNPFNQKQPLMTLTDADIQITGAKGIPTEFVLHAHGSLAGVSCSTTLTHRDEEWAVEAELHEVTGREFADWINREFEYSLPAIAALRLDTIYASYNTGTKGLSFRCSGNDEIFGASAQFSLEVSKDTDHAAARGHLTLFLPGPETNTMTFDIDVTRENSSTTFIGRWQDEKGIALSSLIPDTIAQGIQALDKTRVKQVDLLYDPSSAQHLLHVTGDGVSALIADLPTAPVHA